MISEGIIVKVEHRNDPNKSNEAGKKSTERVAQSDMRKADFYVSSLYGSYISYPVT